MGAKAKLASVCMACALSVCAVGYAAFVFSQDDLPELSAGVFADGVNFADDFLTFSVTEPSGDEQGISPLVVDCAIDAPAARSAGLVRGGSICLEITLSYAQGIVCADEALARRVIEEGKAEVLSAYAVTEQGAAAVQFVCDAELCGSGVEDMALKVKISLSVGDGEAIRYRVTFAFSHGGETADALEFFMSNSEALFEVSAAVI